MAPELFAGEPSDRFSGKVVGSWPDPTGRKDHVTQFHSGSPSPFEPLGDVADGEHRDQVDTDFIKLVGEIVRVAVDHLASRDFVAGRKNHRSFDHQRLLVPTPEALPNNRRLSAELMPPKRSVSA